MAATAIVVSVLHTWLSRSALNNDGVSYLDLAGRLTSGDWSSFAQAYWSPLYSALIAVTSVVTGRGPVSILAAAHAINGLATIAAITLLWWWSRQVPRRFFARAVFATLMLISSGLPRIEAVTPDVLLLAMMAFIGYELLVRRGERWAVTGVLLGAAFLAKTSAWPWLLLTIPLRLWAARDASRRRDVLRSSVVCAAVMLTWIAAMSAKAKHLTLGSAGRLNYCWYIDACDSRTPDTHRGRHTAYQQTTLGSSRAVVWAEFPDADRWTYAPWSDPTAWEAGVITRVSSAPTAWELVAYWGRQARISFGLWLLPVLLGVLLPWVLLEWRPDTKRRLLDEDRPVLVVALLGLAGVGQFVLIHSEPRLIAPYGLLFALAVLHGSSAEALPTKTNITPRFAPPLRQVATAFGLLVAAGYAVPRLREGFSSSPRLARVITSIGSTNASLAKSGLSQARIVVLGPAMPVEGAAFLSGAHIIAQVLPGSVEHLLDRPPDQLRDAIATLFAGKAQIAWLTTPDGTVTMMAIPPR